jgi:polyhydroxyalkanoate synthase
MTRRGSPPLAALAAVAEAGDMAAEEILGLLAVDVGETESEIVAREHAFDLHRYEPADRRHETPVLITYALVNRPYILDLQPDRSVVRRLLEAGFVVYLIDWGEPSRLDATLGLADYVCRFLDTGVDAALADAGVADLHLLGYCMGGTMAAMYAAIEDPPLRSLTCLATPIAFDGTGGILEQWATYLDPDTLVDTSGNVPGELLAASFAMMEPVEHTVGKLATLYDHADDPEFLATFLRMERWIWDAVDVPGAVFRDFLSDLYQSDALLAGSVTLRGEPVDLSRIDVPSLHLVGAEDHLVPPAASRPLADAIDHEDTQVLSAPVGHIGLSVSGTAHAALWPEVTDWLAARSDTVGHAEDGTRPAAGDRARARATVAAVSRRAAAALPADGGAVARDDGADGNP